ncbi:KilA-N domain-containing protein [Massilia rubra]|uniref:KilA-N domain-containing protein n=1 Tax=Massilia rubra TaxID=2607910 RepID=A0ABX0LQ37_9BURK|nr:KilA-N domain-containing protein [Massilia rubra]NHZ36560.1 KilA-N domain-containing protein [Massilia rubra]
MTAALVTAEYQGVAFSFQDDGWFNATTAAGKYGKKPNDWLKLDETKEYISVLSSISNASQNRIWHKTKRGNNGGTWLHPKLAVRFSQWLDMRFAVWCDYQIDLILRGDPTCGDLAGDLSTVAERMPLYLAAAHALARYRLAFPVSYRAFNAAAGSTNFRFMTKAQANRVVPVAARIASGTDTPADWRLLHVTGQMSTAGAGQLALSGFEEVEG